MAKKVAAAGPVEGPWTLPGGWRWERLGDVAELIRGVTYAKPQVRCADDHNALALLRGNNIQSGSLHFDDLTYVDETCVKPHQFIRAEDIVLTMSSGSIALIGKSGWVARDLDRTTFGAFCGVVRSNGITSRLLYHFLQTDHYRRLIRDLAKGTNINNLKRDHLIEMMVPVPPDVAQVSIVARIDELFAEIDNGEAALARARDDLATWRKALLKAAVTGELTVDWRSANPPTETGSDLLASILIDRRDRWEADARNKGRKYIEPPAAAEAGLPVLPDGWLWSSMGQLLDRIEAGLNVKCVERPPHRDETGLLKISAVTWWRFNERASKTLADSHVHPDQWLIAEGDLLVSRANTLELVGAPAVVEGLSLRLMLSDKVLRLAMPAYLRRWTFYVMRSPYGRAWIEGRSTGNQLSMRNISQDALRAMPIPLPPRTELDHIVELLEAASSQHETTANDLSIFDAAAATLRQSSLAAAFRGELA